MKISFQILFGFLAFFSCSIIFGQIEESDTIYTKRVLESTEIDLLSSYYEQDGNNASVTGGIGDERLTDVTPTIVVSIPLNDDDVLTIDAGISAYTSASSSNLDPFDSTGASRGGDDDDDDDNNNNANPTGSPWVESSGASRSDVWGSVNVSYSHSSKDRNKIWNINAGFATEYDYYSIGFGAGYTRLFNNKNTEFGVQGKVFIDQWNPYFPTELNSFFEANQDLNNGFFSGVDILDQNGNVINKNAADAWRPLNEPVLDDEKRNTYSLSFSISQILSQNFQASLFMDLILQQGWLANPLQRVYFADRDNFYIGNAADIPNYTTRQNNGVFHLADDIERLPDSRFKLPVGMRANYFFNEFLSVRTYYRFYYDDWGIQSHTAQIELPIKLGDYFTFFPSYRYYNQTAADYFSPYNEALSTQEFYTSDFDLSDFNANQYGFGFRYQDPFQEFKLWKLGLKSIDLNYSHYNRSNGLTANIISLGIKFVLD